MIPDRTTASRTTQTANRICGLKVIHPVVQETRPPRTWMNAKDRAACALDEPDRWTASPDTVQDVEHEGMLGAQLPSDRLRQLS